MNEYKKEVFNTIEKELKYLNILEKKLSFGSFKDGIITFFIEEDDTLNEFHIIADDVFTNEETPKSLMSKKRITYFKHDISLKNWGIYKIEASESYQPLLFHS